MDAFKRFSIAALAAILVAGAAPAFAQDTRDTRPQQDRPIIEHTDESSGSGSITPEQKPRLPKSTSGISCVVADSSLAKLEALVVNTTGKTIPAGTNVTLYVQPGNIQKTYKLWEDWQPGKTRTVLLNEDELELPAECSLKVSYRQGTGDSKQTISGPERAGDKPPVFVEPKMPELICHLWNGKEPSTAPDYLTIENTTDQVIPAGTKITWTLKSGKTVTITLKSDWKPGSQLGFTGEDYGLDPNLPWDTVCSASIV